MKTVLILNIVTLIALKGVVPFPSNGNLVVSTSELPQNDGINDNNEDNKQLETTIPKIVEMHITSNVSNRYATTRVASKVKNSDAKARETTFFLILPENAFITEFIMEIGGKEYKAYVKEKEEAKQIYDEAKSTGQSAAHVEVSARDSNKFTVSVNLEPESKAKFYLTYEELLQRQKDMYELVINIHPGQLVKDMKIDVFINESRPLTFIKTPALRTGNEISKNSDKLQPTTAIEKLNSTSSKVTFVPTVEEQINFGKELDAKENEGISGQFIVQYGVDSDPRGGEVLLADGYFVHFFSPSDFPPLPKQVIFVLDTSGSMSGTKIEQLRDAMSSILKQIKGDNLLSIVAFSSDAVVYDLNTKEARNSPFNNFELDKLEEQMKSFVDNDLPESTLVTNEVIENAMNVSAGLEADGLTNMMSGLLTSLSLVEKSHAKYKNKYQPLVIFLTDGHPTSTSSADIQKHITKLNKKSNAAIMSLSFGEGADKEFLREFSKDNLGFSRHIYEAADASLQLQDFFEKISSPLLSNITFTYADSVENVTKTLFPIFFAGSEIVVSGRYDVKKSSSEIPIVANCWAGPALVTLKPTEQKPASSLERLWAYLTVKQNLENSTDPDSKKKALALALKYSFVTSVTSLVVVKPNDTSVSSVDGFDYSSSSTGLRSYIAPRPGSFFAKTSSVSSVRFASIASPNAYYPPPIPFHARLPGSATLGFSGYGATYAAPIFPSTTAALFPDQLQVSYDSDNAVLDPKVVLPWLSGVLNANDTLTLPEGVFDVGLNSDFTDDTASCTGPVGSNATDTGKCVLLRKCPYESLEKLTDFDTYKQHFCALDNNRLAGVCCKFI